MILRKCSRSRRSSSSTALADAVVSALGPRGCRLRRSSLSGAARSSSASAPMPLALSPGHGSCSRSSSRPRRSPLRITLAGGSLSPWGRGLGSGAFRDTAHVADIPRALLRPRAQPARTRTATLPARAASPARESIARGGQGRGSALQSRCHRDWEQNPRRTLRAAELFGLTGYGVCGVVPAPAV